MRVLWYVHHQGAGHLHRARAVVAVLRERGHEVTVASSLPPQPWAPWLELARDDVEGFTDPTAHGRMHWAPVDNAGHRARLAALADAARRVDVAVVDISVEVTVVLRTLGVPVVTTLLPGRRDDAPHLLGFDLADAVVAAWPSTVPVPQWFPHDRVHRVGGISRYEHRTSKAAAPSAAARAPRAAVWLGSAGGGGPRLDDLAAPGWEWTVVGPPGDWVDDPWPLLTSADVVVATAGQGTIADLAAAGARAVVVPQERAFGEQTATGERLGELGLAVVLSEWPSSWGPVLERAAATRPRWSQWQVAGAAARYADVVEGVARCGPSS